MENILIDSIKTSLIDRNMESILSYQHKLISNREEKIISLIRRELENCDEFIISVAFITLGGVTMILEQLKDLEERGIKGKILTGDYLTFTQPKALKKLLEFKNIELKILSDEKFHAKGYFFRKGDIWTMIVGSSNLTQTALTINFEWNLKINSLKDGKIAHDILNNFYEIYNKTPRLDSDFLDKYEKIYMLTKEYNKKRQKEIKEYKEITPNLMQRQALENLKVLRNYEKRGLLISATGTGKTYLSAFDVKNSNPQKVLFIAHRKTILQKSREAYENILRNKKIVIYGDEEVEGADEQLLVLKIVEQYIRESKLNILYKLLTRKETNPKDTIKIGVEAQPLTHREKEGNTYLDLAMGSIKKRGNTESGIELDTTNKEQDFVFCEAKWKSDLSVGVSKCSIRNQLQRVIENALIFVGENFKGNIFVALITPEIYKKHYELGLNTRFYSCKYFEYKGNIRGTFLRELDLIKELGVIPFNDEKGVERKSKYREIVEKNLDKLILNWVTFEELITEISNDSLKSEYEKYNTEE